MDSGEEDFLTTLKDIMTTPPLTIDYDEATDSFHLHGATQAHQMGLLGIPGCRFAAKGKNYWIIPARYAQVVAVGNTYQLEWTQAAIDRFTELDATVTACRELRDTGLKPDAEALITKLLSDHGVSPKPGQASAIVHLATAERAGNFSETGQGKSLIVSGAMKLYEIAPVLIVCPTSVLYNWQRELSRFGIASVVLDGTLTQRRKIEESFDPTKTSVMICSFGIARTSSRISGYGNTKLKRCNDCGGYQDIPDKKCEVHERFLNSIPWAAVVVDEAQRIRDPHTPQTRSVWHLAHSARYFWALTATPIESNADEFWSLLHAMDPREFPSSSKNRDRYLLQHQQPWGGVEILGLLPATKDEFHDITDWRWRRDVKVGMPDTVYEVRTCTLSPKNAKAYHQMETQMMAEVGGGVITASNHMVKYGRLRQMANATCEIGIDGEITMHDPSEKLDLFEDTLSAYSEPIIAWFASLKLLKLASERLTAAGVKHDVIHGGVSGKERQAVVDRFQNGEIDLLLLNPAAGGEGITLTRARISIWVMRPDSSIMNTQANGRNKRYGVEHEELLEIDLITLGTVEEDLLPKADVKQAAFDEVIRS